MARKSRTPWWLGPAAFALVVILGIAWAIFFYTHTEKLCHMSVFAVSKECARYNISRLGQ